jgi:gliding motility-associated-like protein
VFDGFEVSGGNANVGGSVSWLGWPTSVWHRQGAGFLMYGGGTNLKINTCVFTSNYATNRGAGLVCHASASPSITNTVFDRNSALGQEGGGVFCFNNSSPTFLNCIFYGNTSYNGGGLTAADNSDFNAINCTFSGNDATNIGGAMNLLQLTNPIITNCIIYGNTATSGSVSIATSNTSTPVSNYNTIEGGGFLGTGNVTVNPAFTNSASPLGSDNIWMTDDDGLQLSCGSPVVNSGTNAGAPIRDILGANRPQNSTADMGAYEQLAKAPYTPVPNSTTRLYVKKCSTGDGTSWANAMGELADALNLADNQPSTTITEIWLAAGTYTPLYNTNYDFCNSNNRLNTFMMVNGVSVYGGFSSAGVGTSTAAANPNTNTTTLTGEINIPNVKNDNCYHVVTATNLTAPLSFNGFKVVEGYANTGLTTNRFGINYVWNSVGAGILIAKTFSNFAVSNCTVSDNYAFNGGGIAQIFTCTVGYNNLSVVSNTAVGIGGGVFSATNSIMNVVNSNFDDNTSGSDGGGISFLQFSTANLLNTTINNNRVYSDYGGGVQLENYCIFTGTNIAVCNNDARVGGGFYCYNACSVSITNAIIVANTISGTNAAGGAVCLDGGGSASSCNFTLKNSTVFRNRNRSMSGFINDEGLYSYLSTSTFSIQNSIIWGNGIASTQISGSYILNMNYSNCQSLLPVGSNINMNPLFTNSLNPIGADNVWMTADDGLQLNCNSPCINSATTTGAPATDILNTSRPQSTGIDMGAYEMVPFVITSNTQTNVVCNGGSTGSASVSVSSSSFTPTYTWLPSGGSNASTSSLTVGNYTVIVTNSNSCTRTQTFTITQPPAITLTPLANSPTICSGTSATLSANASGGTGAISYSWNAVAGNASLIIAPALSTVYSVSVNDANNCSKTTTLAITVNITPTLSVNSGTICSGNSFSILPSGANTYSIQGGSFNVSPTTSTSYSVIGTAINGCVSANTVTATISVNTTPTVSVNNGTICSGNSFSIVPSGADTYTIQSGIFNVSPLSNSSYTLNGTSLAGCISANTATSTIVVNTKPTVSVNNGTICSGNSFSIIPSGASTYTIQGGSANVSPLTTSSYTLNGTSTQGCISANTATSNITVNSLPTVSVNNGTICSGNSFSIIPSGASTYTIQGGNANVTPLSTTSYTLNGTSIDGCISANTATSNVTVNTTPTVSVNNGTICSGNSFSIVPSGGVTYTIQSGIFNVSPLSNSSYTVNGTSLAGCISANTATSTIVVNTTPTVSVNMGTICSGNSFSIVPSGASAYTIQGGSFNVSPLSSSSYTVKGTSIAGCVSANTATATISVNTTPTVSVNSGTICSGNSFSIIPSGASAYTIQGGSFNVNPMTSTAYSVTGMAANGCIAANIATANISVDTTPTVSVNSGTICSGNSFSIIPSGANNYTIQGGSFNVSPLSNSNYTINGTSIAGCVSANTATATISVNTTPTVSVNSGTICSGNSFSIIPSGASAYTIQGGSFNVSPLSNSSYTINGTSIAGCISANNVTANVTVNTTPTITVGSGTLCSGQSYTISPSGANTYTIQGGSTNVSPLTTTAYTINGTALNGCLSANTATATVTVYITPTITVTSGTVCIGNLFVILPSGASNYIYSSGSATVLPITNTSYSITGTSNVGCVASNTAVSSVTVYALPSLSLVATNTSVCLGNSATLSVSGASSYTWTNGSNATSIAFTPSLATTYTVTGTNNFGCSNSGTQTIDVYPSTNINVVSTSTSLCIGNSATLTASGMLTYTWNTTTIATSIVTTPSANAIYTVVGTDVNGCNNSATLAVNLSQIPTITIVASSAGVCSGGIATLTASGANAYSWNTNANTSFITVSPTSNTAYTVTGTNAIGCSANATITMNAYPSPLLNLGNDVEVSLGSNYQFNPSQTAAISYTWSPYDYLNVTNSINPITTPLEDISYVVVASSANGCKTSDTIHVKVLKELIIANFMSANDDGLNDTWKVNLPTLIKEYSVDIIDSYGQLVYSKTNNYNNEFDGKRAGQSLPDGVYYYFIKDGNKIKYKGSITMTK